MTVKYIKLYSYPHHGANPPSPHDVSAGSMISWEVPAPASASLLLGHPSSASPAHPQGRIGTGSPPSSPARATCYMMSHKEEREARGTVKAEGPSCGRVGSGGSSGHKSSVTLLSCMLKRSVGPRVLPTGLTAKQVTLNGAFCTRDLEMVSSPPEPLHTRVTKH